MYSMSREMCLADKEISNILLFSTYGIQEKVSVLFIE
jgi:hypothetical protein